MKSTLLPLQLIFSLFFVFYSTCLASSNDIKNIDNHDGIVELMQSHHQLKTNYFFNNISLEENSTAKVQLIHNAPDPSLSAVDVYLNGTKILSNVNFRTSSAFLDVPAEEDLEITVAPANSNNVSESFFTNTYNFTENEKYILVASGVNSTVGFNTSINSPIDFTLNLLVGAREQSLAIAGITDILFFHGAPDIPNITIDESSIPVGTIVNNLLYNTFTNYLQIATGNYTLTITESASGNDLNVYDIPLLELGLQNKAITVLTSGFLNTSNNNNGEGYGLWVSLPEGGTLIELPFEGNCVTFQTPFSEVFSGSNWTAGTGFLSFNDAIDECWQRNPENGAGQFAWATASTTPTTTTGPSAAFEGNNFMYTVSFLGNPNDEAFLKTPIINLGNLTAPSLSFNYHMFGNQMGSLQVEAREFGESSWNLVANIVGQQQNSKTADWLEQEVDLGSFANKNIEVRFKGIRGSGGNSNIAIDAVKFQELTNCIPPSGLFFTSISNNSVQINWASQTNPVNWFVLNEGGNIATSTPVAQGTTTNANVVVENLQANTTYDVYLQTDCDGNLSNFVSQNFTTTACAITEQCTYTFNLLDQFGDGWDGNILQLRQDGIVIGTIGENFTSGNSFTQEIGLCSGAEIEVFWPQVGSFFSELGFSIVDPFGEEIYNLGFSSQGQVNSVLYTINVNCTPPTCPRVSNLESTNVTSNSASFSWTNLPTATEGYTWFVYADGANPEVATPLFTGFIATGSTQVVIEGLNGDTTYDVYLQALCNNSETSDLSDVTTITTLCDVFNTPYTENFNSNDWVVGTGFFNTGGNINQCWTRNPLPNNGHFWGVASGNALPANSGPDAALVGTKYIYSVGAAGGNGAIGFITSPLINLTGLDKPGAIFSYYMYGIGIGELRVEVKTSAQTSWTEVFSVTGQQQTAANQNWIEALVDLEGFENEIIQLRFVSQKGNNFNASIAIDGFSVDNLPDCVRPTNLSISNVGTETATLSWEAGDSSSTSYTWLVYNAGDDPSVNAPVSDGTTTETSVEISGLSQGNSYDAYVVATCNNDQTSILSLPLNFNTENCEVEDRCVYLFRLIDSFGDGWNGNTMNVLENGQLIQVLGQSFVTGSLQEVEIELCEGSEIELFWNAGGSFANEVGIEIINVFEEVIFQKNPGTGSQNSSLFTFDADCSAPDGCFPPQNFSFAEITPTSIELTWDETLTAISGFNWFIFNENDNILTTPPIANGNSPAGSTSVVVTGLNDNTNYKAFIRSDCGITAVSAISNPLFFETPCSPFTAPYAENFDSNAWNAPIGSFASESIAECWIRTPQPSFVLYAWSTGNGFTADITGGNYLNVNNQQGSVGSQAFILLPELDLSTLNEPSLSFFSFTIGANFGSLEVEIKESTASNWQVLKTISTPEQSNASDNWSRNIVDLEGYENQIVQIRLKATRGSNFNGRILIDDLKVDELPACLPPLNLIINNITDISANLSFTEEDLASNGYEWEVYEANANPLTASPLVSGTNLTNLNISIENLLPSTTYDVYVKSLCASENSELSLGLTFTTLDPCEEVLNIAFTNITDTQITATWDLVSSGTDGYLWFLMNQGENPLTGTPVFSGFTDEDTNEVTVNNLTASTTYDFYVQTDCNYALSEVSSAFSFTTLDSCQEPENISVSNITTTTALASWDLATNGFQGYTWYVMLEGENPTDNTPVATAFVDENTSNVQLSNLTANTTYDFYVQSLCGFSNSEAQIFVTFTTLEICNAPDEVEVNNVTTSTASVSWNSVANANLGYTWFLFNEGDDVNEDTPVQSGTTNNTSVELVNLSANTNYFVVIQSDCGEQESDFSEAAFFSTENEGQPEPPSNNVPCNAISLLYEQVATATNSNATFEDNEVQSSCLDGQPSPSVWFSFTYNSSSSFIEVFTDVTVESITIFETSDCSDYESFTELICDASEFASLPNLIIGNTYVVQVILSEEVQEFDVLLDSTLSTTNVEEKNLNLYPSPATTYITIETSDLIEEYSIVNMLGQQVMKSKVKNEGNIQVNVQNLVSGKYFIKLKTNAKTEILSFLKE